MNVQGTVLERKESNKFYTKFKKENPNSQNELIDWKCWILKKYFRDNVISNITMMVISVCILIFASSTPIFKIFGATKLNSLIIVILLVLGVVGLAAGLVFSITNLKRLKHAGDFLWNDDDEINSERGLLVSKIVKYYDKQF